MNTYLIFTTTDEEFEISQGTYLIAAESSEKAKSLIKTGDRITEVREVKINPEQSCIVFEEAPIVEAYQ